MRTLFLAGLLALTLAAPAALAQAPAATADGFWSRATAASAPNGAAFGTVSAGAPDRLLSASSPVAERVELHVHEHANGIMRMVRVAGFDLGPGTPLTLAPGGAHIMLMGLKAPLKAGDRFPLTLAFRDAAPVTVQVEVRAPGAGRP